MPCADPTPTLAPLTNEAVIHLGSKDQVKDLAAALNRALNTWEEAPKWLFGLCDRLDARVTQLEVPIQAAASAPVKTATSGFVRVVPGPAALTGRQRFEQIVAEGLSGVTLGS